MSIVKFKAGKIIKGSTDASGTFTREFSITGIGFIPNRIMFGVDYQGWGDTNYNFIASGDNNYVYGLEYDSGTFKAFSGVHTITFGKKTTVKLTNNRFFFPDNDFVYVVWREE